MVASRNTGIRLLTEGARAFSRITGTPFVAPTAAQVTRWQLRQLDDEPTDDDARLVYVGQSIEDYPDDSDNDPVQHGCSDGVPTWWTE